MIPRKSMKTVVVVVAMIVPAIARAVQQQPAPQTAGTAQPVAQAAVTGCAQAHPMAERTIDMADRRLEAARQTNSPAAMRAAIDDMQAALRQLRTEIAPCAALHPDAAAALGAKPAPPAPQAAPRQPAASIPAAVDPHAGHVRPGPPQTRTPTRATPSRTPEPRPAAQPRATTPTVAKPPAADASRETANMPGRDGANMNTTASSPAQTLDLPTRPQDLACATKVNPKTAPRATYAGKTYYFCSAADRDRFVKAPAAYRPKQ